MASARQAAQYREQQVGDVDAQAQSLSAWQQDYLQLSDGPFLGQLDEVRHTHRQIFHEYTSLATWQQCQPWTGAIWFGLPSSPAAPGPSFNAQTTAAHHLLICPSGYDFTLRTPPGFGIFGLVLDQAQLAEAVQRRVGRPLPTACRQPGSITLTAQNYWHLSHALRQLLLTVRATPQGAALLDPLTDALLPLLLALLAPTQRPATTLPQRQRQVQLIHSARALLLQTPPSVTTVETLAARLYLTPRTLHNCVRAVLGITPLQFIHAVRLQALRRDLRNPALMGRDLQDLAARYGFWHWSHLSQAYQRRFGESLATTRLRREPV